MAQQHAGLRHPVLKPGDRVVDLDPGFLYFASAFGSLVSKAGSVSVAYRKSKGEPILKQYRALNGKGGGAAIKLCDTANSKQLSKACDDASLVRLRLSARPPRTGPTASGRSVRARRMSSSRRPTCRRCATRSRASSAPRSPARAGGSSPSANSDLVERPIYEIAQLDETTLLLQLEEAHHG